TMVSEDGVRGAGRASEAFAAFLAAQPSCAAAFAFAFASGSRRADSARAGTHTASRRPATAETRLKRRIVTSRDRRVPSAPRLGQGDRVLRVRRRAGRVGRP